MVSKKRYADLEHQLLLTFGLGRNSPYMHSVPLCPTLTHEKTRKVHDRRLQIQPLSSRDTTVRQTGVFCFDYAASPKRLKSW